MRPILTLKILLVCFAITVFASFQLDAMYQKKAVFPEDYLGFWEGDVINYTIGPNQVSRMTLHLFRPRNPPSNSTRWEITYQNDAGLSTHSYFLSTGGEKNKRFQIDLGNNEVVWASFLGNCLYWNRSIGGTRIDYKFQFDRQKDCVHVELLTTIENDKDKTIGMHSSPPSGVLCGTLEHGFPKLPELKRK